MLAWACYVWNWLALHIPLYTEQAVGAQNCSELCVYFREDIAVFPQKEPGKLTRKNWGSGSNRVQRQTSLWLTSNEANYS